MGSYKPFTLCSTLVHQKIKTNCKQKKTINMGNPATPVMMVILLISPGAPAEVVAILAMVAMLVNKEVAAMMQAEVTARAKGLVFSSSKNALCKKKFPVTSNLRYMHEVLNVDEIKN
jgi:hypothetical protein